MLDRSAAETLVKVLGVVYVVWGVFLGLAGLALTVGGGFMGGFFRNALPNGLGVVGAGFLIFLGVFFLGTAAFGVLTGVGILNRRPWSRIAGLVLGALALFNFPVGTVIGAFSIWLLGFDRTAAGLFEARPGDGGPRVP